MSIDSYQSVNGAYNGILEKLKSKENIMGFGHRVYRTNDLRSKIIQAWENRLNDDSANVYF